MSNNKCSLKSKPSKIMTGHPEEKLGQNRCERGSPLSQNGVAQAVSLLVFENRVFRRLYLCRGKFIMHVTVTLTFT